MINKTAKNTKRLRRAERVRYKLRQTSERPRLVFNKTNRYLTAQIIDDAKGVTLVYATTLEKDFPKHENSKKSKSAATELGKVVADKAKKAGVSQVVLDRSGMVYHGRIAAFADSAREGGLEF
ncbi:50S ribosomal protein L18 [Leptospira biflexa]|jgi:large subunit ribosomal protein L18|uniref:Large ribosomal subunit protein uL18 n=3 Tax=Leptospira TaxID=171 RepID=RL18_LEPBP|nr:MULTISPECIES: 50S ribosomal protein L18 [Leptospira]B0SA31.1 RecName: Full=Large ribosomal subunit protein uL18; AltName: Full=50S ribosomal protein L18 [Leptospira biflexa serovar Patoc strain 'Patoc 1 (Ames)']B0SSG2.1 RecName: Full=Large ribosomal subunit protein uL18; AltName: Full=50S ribosomal protein L18 [Leptospira biflexa serovar Patoc strain 'Patoc 1 (Paris)']ABZ94401.1 50S Ribosomal protein L18 [Leptospira biflexa serovar Patoc strain 'Patoc 1 (Ames)']ABZ98052.1 50S ribosomal prote